MHFHFAARLRQHDGVVWQSENFFIFTKKIPKQDFLCENKKGNAPFAMGVLSHGEGSIWAFSLPISARVSLVVMGSENRLFDHLS